MSAIGPKRTWTVALHMSAFGGKADMTFFGISLSRSLLGVKRTWLIAAHMSAFDPKRTWRNAKFSDCGVVRSTIVSLATIGELETAANWSKF
jgi:hypothetical protein